MRNILKNRKALSTVVTTLIILVVSVLLAGVVTYYAINVVSTRVQQESLNLQYAHVWYSTANTEAEAAILITNTGGRDVVLQNIAVRGQSVSTASLFYFGVTTPGDLQYILSTTIATDAKNGRTSAPTGGSGFAVGNGYWLNATTGSAITLNSGETIAVYMTGNPGSVSVNDVGLTIAISVFTAQATYYKETNVNAAS
jgi:hypothetical protein